MKMRAADAPRTVHGTFIVSFCTHDSCAAYATPASRGRWSHEEELVGEYFISPSKASRRLKMVKSEFLSFVVWGYARRLPGPSWPNKKVDFAALEPDLAVDSKVEGVRIVRPGEESILESYRIARRGLGRRLYIAGDVEHV